MKIQKFSFLFAIIILFGFMCRLGVAAEVDNEIVAFVNDEVITLYNLNNKIKELTGSDPIELKLAGEDKYYEIRKSILDMLIEEKLADGKKRELNITVSPSSVDDAIETIKANRGMTQEEFVAELKNRGIDYETYRRDLMDYLARSELIDYEIKSRIIVSDEEIQNYYTEHIDDFTSEESVHLATIILNKDTPSSQDAGSPMETVEEIISRLKKGENFSRLAMKYSVGPAAETGGDLGDIKTSQLAPELLEIIKDMSPGDISDPIERPSSIQIIKMIDQSTGGVQPLDKVRDFIYNTLFREEVNERYSSWINELKEKAYIRINF